MRTHVTKIVLISMGLAALLALLSFTAQDVYSRGLGDAVLARTLGSDGVCDCDTVEDNTSLCSTVMHLPCLKCITRVGTTTVQCEIHEGYYASGNVVKLCDHPQSGSKTCEPDEEVVCTREYTCVNDGLPRGNEECEGNSCKLKQTTNTCTYCEKGSFTGFGFTAQAEKCVN